MLVWRYLFYLLFLSTMLSSCAVKKKSGSNKSMSPYISEIASSSKKTNLASQYASILGVKEKDLNVNLYIYIDDWMDVPHQLGGMTMSGIDCSGFVSLVYDSVYGKTLPRKSSDMALEVRRKYESQLKEGDLVFFSFGGKDIDHVGIYLFNDKFVHVSTGKGVVISNLKDPWYYKYFVRCGTPK